MRMIKMPDSITVTTDSGMTGDAVVRLEEGDRSLRVYLTAKAEKPRFITLDWYTETPDGALILGDTWERSYGDLCWEHFSDSFVAPWYFLCREGEAITAWGVTVRPCAFVSFQVTPTKITALLDVRNGGYGVELGGRELPVAELVSRQYTGAAYTAVCDFCAVMCRAPLLPAEPVYGGNNWYYAYGNSSREAILQDARYQAMLAGEAKNRPFMVIDDGWQVTPHQGPWIPNGRFGDMAEIADEMKKIGVKPGIWVRFLRDDSDEIPESWRLPGRRGETGALDPTVPQVKERIAAVVRTLTAWGYQLIKHDFTTYDIFGAYGFEFSKKAIEAENWSFHDRTKTTAEIITELYTLILENAGDALILGCNTVSHLSAGLVHIYRTGDDTSGYEWYRIGQYGVNTLAFRLPQHNRFYAVDADCVGILEIPWVDNVKWLQLLANSGTPLFVSVANGGLTSEQFAIMQAAYAKAAVQKDVLVPVDWETERIPKVWQVNGELVRFDWNAASAKEE